MAEEEDEGRLSVVLLHLFVLVYGYLEELWMAAVSVLMPFV